MIDQAVIKDGGRWWSHLYDASLLKIIASLGRSEDNERYVDRRCVKQLALAQEWSNRSSKSRYIKLRHCAGTVQMRFGWRYRRTAASQTRPQEPPSKKIRILVISVWHSVPARLTVRIYVERLFYITAKKQRFWSTHRWVVCGITHQDFRI